MKNMKIKFTNERIIPASGLAVVGDILLTHIGMFCMEKPAYVSKGSFCLNASVHA